MPRVAGSRRYFSECIGVRITEIRERSVPISRYIDPALPSGGLTTSIVAVTTDCIRDGKAVIGYGFSSIGRFAQSGLIRERFAPRLLASAEDLDPLRAWDVMMKGEKPGGHGERCVAVGTLDMALWDAAAKIAGAPLHRHLAEVASHVARPSEKIAVYAGGGYPYPTDDIRHLRSELQWMMSRGYTRAKIKIGAASLEQDLRRIEAVLELLPADRVAVDAMNAYGENESLHAAKTLAPYGLWWFEDICDPLDFKTHADVASIYPGRIAAGEALFSVSEAKLLHEYGGLRPGKDILLFDPVHCYGLTGYVRIIETLEALGWPRAAFWPHGGHLFCLHIVAALGLGGAEVNPRSFAPFGGLAGETAVRDGFVTVPDLPGIGFEGKPQLFELFEDLAASTDPLPLRTG